MRGERRGGIISRRLTDGSAVYYIDYRDATGKRRQERVGPNYRMAVRARAARLGAVTASRFNIRSAKGLTFRQFVDETWRPQVLVHRKPSTMRGYEWMLADHLLPHFGALRLQGITRPAIKAQKAAERHQSRAKSPAKENPNRALLSRKTIVNLVALLSSNELANAMRWQVASGMVRCIKPGTPDVADWPIKDEAKYLRFLLPSAGPDEEAVKMDVFLPSRDYLCQVHNPAL